MKSINHISGKRRGQVWTVDFIVGLLLFTLVVLITVKVAFSMSPSQDHIIVYRDAVHLSDALLSQGYPSDWTISNVLLPGIAENNRINNTKLAEIAELNYSTAKTLLHVTSDYIFFLRNGTEVINTGNCVYGYNVTTDADCNPELSNMSYDNLAKIDRFVIYNSTVVIMTVYTWN
jgi:hypothetical protein